MKNLINELQEVLIKNNNPILNSMDCSLQYKTKKKILERFQNNDLICFPELLELYQWKSGCDTEFLLDLNNEDFHDNIVKLFSFGNFASYIISADMFLLNKRAQEYYADKCMVPFILNGYFEYPILLNMNPQSNAYKSLFLLCPPITKSEKPVMMYDSLETWLTTIIQCYKQKIYHIDEKGHLNTDVDTEYILSKELNPKSEYWKLFV